MSHIIEPSAESVAAYVSTKYDERAQRRIMHCLSGISDIHGERAGYLQAAVLTAWEEEVERLAATNEEHIFRSLNCKIRTINADPREFFRSFNPPSAWENRFRCTKL